MDFAVPTFVTVLAAAEGMVIESRLDETGYGWTVKVRHAGFGETRYGHMLERDLAVVGQLVVRGEQIGVSDNTGFSTGPHLHFGLRLEEADGSIDRSNANGYYGYVDPLPYLAMAF